MKKLLSITLLFLGTFFLASCGSNSLESVTYKLTTIPGATTVTLEYDKDNYIQKVKTESELDFDKISVTKEVFEEGLKTTENMYKEMKGVEYIPKISDNKMTYKLIVIVKDVSSESLPVLFPNATKDGKVKLDDYLKNIESAGFKKK